MRVCKINNEAVYISSNWAISDKINARTIFGFQVIDTLNLTTIQKNDDVEFVAYKAVHPLLRKIELHVVSDNPSDATNTAIKNLQKQVKKLRSKSF